MTYGHDVDVFVARRVVCDKNWNYAHIIPYNRLYVVLSGEGRLRCAGRDYVMRPDWQYLIPAHVWAHGWCPNRMEKMWCHFNLPVSDGHLDLFNLHDASFLQLPVENPSLRKTLFDRLIELHHDPAATLSPVERIEETAILRLLVLPFLEALGERTKGKAFEKNSERLIKVKEYIEKNLRRSPSLSEAAEFMGVHPTYLTNWFSARLGEPLVKHWNRRRIERAQRFLWNSDLSVKEIATQLGFNDTSNFSKMFQKFTRNSPSAYRDGRQSIFNGQS